MVLCQFTKETENDKTLADIYRFPPHVYAIGRLDKDSEGMLLLSDDKTMVDKVLNPKFKIQKTYWVQVEGEITDQAILKLEQGINLGSFITQKAKARKIDLPKLPDRYPPIRFRNNIPTSWLELTISEGKNRQVRRMTAAVGFPTLRLVRVGIGTIRFKNLVSGIVIPISKSELTIGISNSAPLHYF